MMSEQQQEKRIDLPVSGMTCASCVRRVEKGLKATTGVMHATVNLATKKATIQYNEKASLPDLVASIHKMGYAVHQQESTLQIGGISCAACVGRIERAIKKVPGVLEASVNLATEKATISYIKTLTDTTRLKNTVRSAG
ncbi:MAG: copper ion binding protein, partial [Nitrospirota bacterium]|nr:copper ion binding protein [Nitrospirota bacterium]